MAPFSQRLTRSSLNDQPTITLQHLASEFFPFCASSDDCDLDAHTLSAYGTSTDGILFLRRPKRLAVSRPKKPQNRTTAVRKLAWPDPRDAKEVASFHQKYLNSQHDNTSLQSTHTVYARPPQSIPWLCDSLTIKSNCLIASGSTISTSNRLSRRAVAPPPRFTPHANEL